MAQVQTETRRRIRTRASAKGRISGGTTKKKLDELTRAMRDAETVAAAAQKKADDARAEALKLMQDAKLDIHNCAYGELKVKVSPGRSSTYIDPETYHNAVSDNGAFYDSVKVQKGKAEEHLSGKELDAISVVTQGKPGAPQLKTEFYWPPEEDE